MTITKRDLIDRFTYHPPSEAKTRIHKLLRDAVFSCAVFVLKMTPSCREQSLALTRLEEALFYANAALARNEFEVPNDGA